MPTLPYSPDDDLFNQPVFLYWRDALPIMAEHYYHREKGKRKATCIKCEVAWPCDAGQLAFLLAETTRKLVIDSSIAYGIRRG